MSENYSHIASVLFRNNSKPYSFGTNDSSLQMDDKVVVSTVRGTELGVISTSLRVNTNNNVTDIKPILRRATQQDLTNYQDNIDKEKEAMNICNKYIEELNLSMNLVNAEYTLDRSQILFVYVSEERVDFRELLKKLSGTLHCRIELRQVGPRDKAKIVGGIGVCGRETCCSKFMREFDVVSINMAKNQMLALNQAKLSGQCGKFMCCLKFEDETYKALKEGLPKINSNIEYNGTLYKLTNLNVITSMAKLENREAVEFITFDELKAKGKVIKKEQPKPKKKAA